MTVNERANNIAIYQPERWKEITEKTIEKRASNHLNAEFIDKVLKAIHQQSLEVQNGVLNK